MNLGCLLLFQKAFLLKALWFLGGWGTGETEEDLDGVVDEPLQSCEGTDHDDTRSKTLP